MDEANEAREPAAPVVTGEDRVAAFQILHWLAAGTVAPYDKEVIARIVAGRVAAATAGKDAEITGLRETLAERERESVRLAAKVRWYESAVCGEITIAINGPGNPNGKMLRIRKVHEVISERDRLRDENARLAAEASKFRETLKTISEWDCLNPQRVDLLGDLLWLSGLVEFALATTPLTARHAERQQMMRGVVEAAEAARSNNL